MLGAALLVLSNACTFAHAQPWSVTGYVEVEATGIRVVGAHVFVEGPSIRGAVTNQDGYFSLVINSEQVTLAISHVSYAPRRIGLKVTRDTTLLVKVLPATVNLGSIEVQGAPIAEESARISTHRIPVALSEVLPALAGEVDIQKTLQLMPGVQGGAEGLAGLYVRGGRPDQNLILLDGMPLYNPSHGFGFFSVFHPAVVKDVEFIKGGFPARYGGRLSSVVNVSMREGSTQSFRGQGTIGLLASNLVLEGPLVKDRASITFAARRTYLDVLIWPFQSPESRFGFRFYDISAKAQMRVSKKDNVSLTLHGGQDKLFSKYDNAHGDPRYTDEGRIDFGWANRMGALRWGHILNTRIYLTATAGVVQYERESAFAREMSSLEAGGIQSDGLRRTSNQDYLGRLEVDYVVGSLLSMRLGLEGIQHKFNPSRAASAYMRTDSLEAAQTIERDDTITADTYAAYLESSWSMRSGISLDIGLRASAYQSGTLSYRDLAPRLSVSVPVAQDMAANASWARTNQFVHQLLSTAAAFPTELWIPSLEDVHSQQGHQMAVGLVRRMFGHRYTVSIEAFDKRMRGLIAYRENEEYATPPIDWPSVVTTGRGRAWGTEFLLRKEAGATKGWFAYTYSRATRWFSDIGGGEPFPDEYDRRHDVTLVFTHEFNPRVHLAATWVLGSGYPATLPIGEYAAPTLFDTRRESTKVLVEYGSFNGARLPPTHRLDVNMRLHKQLKRSKRTWAFGVYNAYNRRNPSYVFPKMDDGERPVRIVRIS